jgi:uncharacterized protein YbjT (DUF2867 family)
MPRESKSQESKSQEATSKGLILVTAAAGGRQGQTGRHVSEMLLARGVPVRAMVRTADARSERLAKLGAEIFVGDFLDIGSVQRAVSGASAIYFAYPVQPGLLDATAIMAIAARKANISRLVNLVMLRSSPEAPTPRMRQNYLSEQVFDWAGIGAVHLRATVFYENLRALVRTSLSADGPIRLPWGSGNTVVPLVAAADVARVAVQLLTQASLPGGSAYPVIGEIMVLRDIITTFGRVLGREVRYEEITDEAWREAAIARGLNPHAVEHLSQLWRSFRQSGAAREAFQAELDATIKSLGGAKPMTFEAFVRAEQAAFTEPAQ